MFASKLILALPLLAGVCSAIPHTPEKRTVTADVQLFAYGTGISGLPLYYSNTNGMAYIATAPPTPFSNLIWTIDTAGALPWNASITAEDSTITDVGSFYIVATGSSFRSAGFISSNETVPTNASTVGFKTYGSQVVFVDAGVYESKFWATTTDIPGVWSLAWNVLGASQTNSTPVTIKRISI